MNLNITPVAYNNSTPNFQANALKTVVNKQGHKFYYYGIGAMALAAENMSLLNKTKASKIPPAPTPQSILKDIKEPIIIDDKVIFDPASPEKIDVKALLSLNPNGLETLKFDDKNLNGIKDLKIELKWMKLNI